MRWNRLAVFSLAAAVIAVAAIGPTQFAMAEATPSIIAPKAVSSVLNDVTHTGKRYVAVGTRGHVLLSEDGKKWRQVVSPVSRMLNDVQFIDPDTGWAVGYDFAIIKTTDGGETWQLQHHSEDPGWAFYAVFFLDKDRGFAMGERGTFMRSDDGGKTWRDVETDMIDLGMHINAMTRLNNGTLIMVGEKGLVARSNDDGETWEMVVEPYVGSFFGVLPQGKSGFITFGLRGNTYLAPDAEALIPQDPMEWDEYGREQITDPEQLANLGWRFMENPVTESLFGGSLLPNGEAVLVGVNGSVVRGDATAGRMVPIPNPGDTTLGSAVATEGYLIMVGVAGVSRLSIR